MSRRDKVSRKYQGPWRVGAGVRTTDYPGISVEEGVSSGSIRLEGAASIWAITADVFEFDWGYLSDSWGKPTMTEQEFRTFLHCLFQQRGEFGRLVCVLADVERRSRIMRPWWQTKSQRRRMIAQLERCIDALREEEATSEKSSQVAP